MADQKSVAIHYVSFLVEQLLFYYTSLVHFGYFSSQAWFFALSVDVLKKIHQKLRSLNVYKT